MIELDDEVRTRLAGAIESGNVLTAAYVDTAGKPHISFYGSTHVHSADSLAIWVRSPDSELLKTIAQRQHIAFIYGDVSNRVYYSFEGRARIAEEVRDRVYAEMHPIERQFDPEAGGVPVVVDLDRFTMLSAAGKAVQEREA
jgi:general stress protein 26